MQSLNTTENAALERIEHDPMLAQVQTWSAVNSGSGNLAGLATTAGLLADGFAALPGEVELVSPVPVERVRSDGVIETVEHGQHLVWYHVWSEALQSCLVYQVRWYLVY